MAAAPTGDRCQVMKDLDSEQVFSFHDNAVADSSQGREMECLTAEFRHRLGLLPEEEQELSEIFKSKLGLSVIDKERLLCLINDKEHTMRQYSLDLFAQKHFQKSGHDVWVKNTEHQITQPLLPKDSPFDFQASIYMFSAIRRFVKGDFCKSIRVCSKPYIPVMMKIYKVMEIFSTASGDASPNSNAPNYVKNSKSIKTKKQSSIKKLLRTIGKSYSKKISSPSKRSSATKVEEGVHAYHFGAELPVTYEDLLSSINWELELVQFIVSHGIIRKELRDETFCQLCCLVKNCPTKEEADRGWMLHSLCSSCFLPSSQLIGHYSSFLHQMSRSSGSRVGRVMHNLLRTNEVGLRYHPNNSLELKAEQQQAPIRFQVHLVDGRTIELAVDSLCTSQDICGDVSKHIDLVDTFGFSLYVSSYERVSSMGCGADHVMDVITECEHMALDRNDLDLSRPRWILSFRKELFTPWFDPTLDPVSTELIYKQIKDGFSKGDLKVSKGLFEISLAQILYIEYGNLNQDLVRQKLPTHAPSNHFKDSKVFETTSKNVMDIGIKLGLDIGSLDKNEVLCRFISNAAQSLSVNFSALFEAFNYGGFPQLPQQEVVVALNSKGIDILGPDITLKLAHFDFSDIYNASTNSSLDLSNLVLTFLAVDGAEYTLASPNAEVASKITNAFLNGLRKRSRWAVAIKTFVYKDFRQNTEDSEFELQMGDTVELLDEIDEKKRNDTEELLYGICERTGMRGSFPLEVVYIIPTAQRPPQNFLDALKAVGEELSQSTEVQPLRSRVIMSDADTIRRRPESSA